MPDLVVIGAGLAGLAAAHIANEGGLDVRVVAKGMGATHWHAGTVDVLGYLPGDPDPITDPIAVLTSIEQDARHPYAMAGWDFVSEAMDRFVELTKAGGLPYAGEANGRNLLLPSPVGALRPAFLAPEGQHAGDLASEQPMLIVGFDGMVDFYPGLIAGNLRNLGKAARSATLPISLITDRKDYNNVWLARSIESASVLERLADALSTVAGDGERIGLPAILGADQHARVLARLAEATGTAVFEIPTLPPSVPGIRLHSALRRHLSKRGVRVEVGMEVQGFQAGDSAIHWVESTTSAPRALKHNGRYFLLATGGILGGGITSDHTGKVWETIFDLPLTIEQDRSRWFSSRFLDPAGQPIFQGGVAVNRNFQPVGGNSDGPIYANLWAAGGTLAHADFLRERSLEGIAIATGMAAARQIVQA